jgi:DNA-binding transcriptional ArsR family regulator
MKIDRKNAARIQARADILKALAHPTRVFIVEELGRGERCVCELRDMIGADMSTVSKHLSLLRAVGLVTDEKRGTQVFYRLECPCILNLFACVEQAARQAAVRRMEAVS